jgi:hypothetical protein
LIDLQLSESGHVALAPDASRDASSVSEFPSSNPKHPVFTTQVLLALFVCLEARLCGLVPQAPNPERHFRHEESLCLFTGGGYLVVSTPKAMALLYMKRRCLQVHCDSPIHNLLNVVYIRVRSRFSRSMRYSLQAVDLRLSQLSSLLSCSAFVGKAAASWPITHILPLRHHFPIFKPQDALSGEPGLKLHVPFSSGGGFWVVSTSFLPELQRLGGGDALSHQGNSRLADNLLFFPVIFPSIRLVLHWFGEVRANLPEGRFELRCILETAAYKGTLSIASGMVDLLYLVTMTHLLFKPL